MQQRLLRLARLAWLVLFATVSPRAQAPNDALLALRAMELDGAADLSRDAVAVELASDGETLRALRRGLDQDAADTVADRVRELHLCAGYAKAAVKGTVKDGVLRIALEAGTRYRCGTLEFTGNTMQSTETLRERLVTAKEPSGRRESLWPEGEFAAMDADTGRRVRAVVRNAYAEIGRHGTKAEVHFAPEGENGDRMTARITIADEGREVHIASLRLDGLGESEAKTVLDELAFAKDTLASTSNLEDLTQRLQATGRFRGVAVDVPEDPPAVLDPLVVRVQSVPRREGFGTFAATDVQQVKTAMALVRERLERGDVVRIAWDLKEPDDDPSLRILPGAFEARLSNHGLYVRADKVQLGDQPARPFALFLSSSRLFLQYGEESTDFALARAMELGLLLRTSLGEDGKLALHWGFQVHTSADCLLTSLIHPASAEYALAAASSVRREGDVLVLRFASSEVRIAADGSIVGERIAIASKRGPCELSWVAGLDEPPVPEHTTTSSLLPLMVLAFGKLWLSTTESDDSRAASLLWLDVASRCFEFGADAKVDEPRKRRPQLSSSSVVSVQEVAASVLASGAVRRAVPRRAADACAALTNALQGDTRSAGTLFEAMADDTLCGPMLLGAVALVCNTLGNERLTSNFAQLAASKWTFDAVLAEATEFAVEASGRTSMPQELGAAWRAMPELKEWFGELPSGEAGDLAAWKKGLRALWDAIGEEHLREWLRSH